MSIYPHSPPAVRPYRYFPSHKILVAILILLFASVAFACGGGEDPPPPGANPTTEDAHLIVSEPDGESMEFSLEDLRALPEVTREVTLEQDGEQTDSEVSGVLLEDLLDSAEIALREVASLILLAADGYSVEVEADVLADRELISAYSGGGESLGSDDGPLRVFIPGESSMYWVRDLSHIELSRAPVAAEPLKSIVFLETAFGEIESSEYGDGARAIRTRDLVTNVEDVHKVLFFATDGFEKTEQMDVFIEEYLVIDGDATPAFRGPELPRGMHVRDIAYFLIGDRGYYSAARGLDLLDATDVDGERGVSFATLAAAMGLAEADNYVLEAVDGYAVEVAVADLSRGIVVIDDEGQISSLFGDLPKNTRVKNLLTLSVSE